MRVGGEGGSSLGVRKKLTHKDTKSDNADTIWGWKKSSFHIKKYDWGVHELGARKQMLTRDIKGRAKQFPEMKLPLKRLAC